MAKIKLRTGLAGPRGVWERGDVVDVPDAEARRLLALGHAEEIEGQTLAKARPAEAEMERYDGRVEVEAITHDQHGMETAVKIRPAKKARRSRKFEVPPVTVVPVQDESDDE